MENLIKFVRPELLVLIAVLYFIGCAVKKSNVKNTYIPLILGGVGIGLALIWVLAVSPLGTWQEILMAAFTAIVQGVLVAGGSSVYVNELISQKRRTAPKIQRASRAGRLPHGVGDDAHIVPRIVCANRMKR